MKVSHSCRLVHKEDRKSLALHKPKLHRHFAPSAIFPGTCSKLMLLTDNYHVEQSKDKQKTNR